METTKHFYKFIESESMRMMLSEAADMACVFDTNGSVLFVNKIFEKYAGCRPEEYQGKSCLSLYGYADQKKAQDAYTRALKGETVQYELTFRNTGIVCEYKNFPLRNEKGNIIGVMSIARDITARKGTEEGLVALNKSLENRVIDNMEKLVEVNEELMEEIETRRRLEGELKRSVEKLQKTFLGVMQSFALSVESRSLGTIGHQKRVAEIACCIAMEMGLAQERIESLDMAARFHDIGKISIPYEILCNAGQLDETEYNVVTAHPRIGYDMLKDMELPQPVAQIVLQHHERVDGSGYPYGLLGKDILLEAKILGIADVVESMSSPRLYRDTWSIDKVLEEISKNRDTLYDFNVAYACLVIFKEKGFRLEQKTHANTKMPGKNLVRVHA